MHAMSSQTKDIKIRWDYIISITGELWPIGIMAYYKLPQMYLRLILELDGYATVVCAVITRKLNRAESSTHVAMGLGHVFYASDKDAAAWF